MKINSYGRFFLMISLSFIIMLIIMYFMVDNLGHVYLNINKFYMALLMVAPMAIIMLIFMISMYQNKTLNALIIGICALLIIGTFWMLRSQILVGNMQFLRSMIPHHSSAILMCEKASITDQEIIDLCQEIVATQKREISQMQDIMERLNR